MLHGKVLITGGTGFLGRGIMRRAREESWPVEFTIVSRDEKKQAEARARYPEARYVLGDVCDTNRMFLTMLGQDTVIHAAALKYIPEGELNADECVRVNIDGARSIIESARAAHVKGVVGVSTDKAAEPVNVYGMTKAVMERLFAEASDRTPPTKFTTCRYGNVIGSTGSVVPVMQQQFMLRGMVDITDRHMTRFWMSVNDAVDVIIQALAAEPGTVTVPEPKAASMQAVAYSVLGAMGEAPYAPDGDVLTDPRIRIVGKRPGEKQHEELISEHELFRTVKDGEYYHIMPPGSEHYERTHAALASNLAKYLDRETLMLMIAEAGGV